MSIRPDIEAWRRRFSVCLLAALGVLLLTGAREVSLELRHHDARLALVQTQLSEWSHHLAGDSLAARAGDLSSQQALFLVRTCSLPSRQP
jgi:hypothetical protein